MIIKKVRIRQQTIGPAPDDVQVLRLIGVNVKGESVDDFQRGKKREKEQRNDVFEPGG